VISLEVSFKKNKNTVNLYNKKYWLYFKTKLVILIFLIKRESLIYRYIILILINLIFVVFVLN